MSEQLSTATVINFRIARERRMRDAPVTSQVSECRPKFNIDNPVMVTLADGTIVHTRVGDITCDGLKLRTNRTTAQALHPSGRFINIDNPPKVEVAIDLPLPSADLRLMARCSIVRFEQVAPDDVTFTLHFLNFVGSGKSILQHYVRLRTVPVRRDTSRVPNARKLKNGKAN